MSSESLSDNGSSAAPADSLNSAITATVSPATIVTINFNDVPEMKCLPGAWVTETVGKGGQLMKESLMDEESPVEASHKAPSMLSTNAKIFVPSKLSSNAKVFVPSSETKAVQRNHAQTQDRQRLKLLARPSDQRMRLVLGKPRVKGTSQYQRPPNAVMLTITPTGQDSLDLSIMPHHAQRILGRKCKSRRRRGQKGDGGDRGELAELTPAPSSSVKKQKPATVSMPARLLANNIIHGDSADKAAYGSSCEAPSISAADLVHDGLPLQSSAADELEMLMSVAVPRRSFTLLGE
jgi:hypothetical protein